jgi:putative FmdB family regulatory protein
MPRYDYFCHACKQLFSKTPSPTECEEGDVVCPHCGSEEVEQRVSAFYPVSPKESA